MAEYQSSHAPERVTIIEKRGGGGIGLIAFALLAAIVIAAYLMVTSQAVETRKDNAIAGAAQSVGAAADKIGSAVDDAAGK